MSSRWIVIRMDPRLFTNDIETLRDLSCCICLFIPRWAVVPVHCTHLHCMQCMLQLLSRRIYDCPCCRQYSAGMRMIDVNTENRFNLLRYRCAHCGLGFHGSLINVHERTCIERPCRCPLVECCWRGVMRDQNRHMTQCHARSSSA